MEMKMKKKNQEDYLEFVQFEEDMWWAELWSLRQRRTVHWSKRQTYFSLEIFCLEDLFSRENVFFKALRGEGKWDLNTRERSISQTLAVAKQLTHADVVRYQRPQLPSRGPLGWLFRSRKQMIYNLTILALREPLLKI
jgi:hypothetical protein